MTIWSDWRAQHPGTTVLSPRTKFARDYADSPYGPYFATDELMFPAEKNPRRTVERLKNKDPMVLVSVGGGEMKAYAVKDLEVDAKPRGYVDVGGRKIRLHPVPRAGGARVETLDGERVPVAYLYWFRSSAPRSIRAVRAAHARSPRAPPGEPAE